MPGLPNSTTWAVSTSVRLYGPLQAGPWKPVWVQWRGHVLRYIDRWYLGAVLAAR